MSSDQISYHMSHITLFTMHLYTLIPPITHDHCYADAFFSDRSPNVISRH